MKQRYRVKRLSYKRRNAVEFWTALTTGLLVSTVYLCSRYYRPQDICPVDLGMLLC